MGGERTFGGSNGPSSTYYERSVGRGTAIAPAARRYTEPSTFDIVGHRVGGQMRVFVLALLVGAFASTAAFAQGCPETPDAAIRSLGAVKATTTEPGQFGNSTEIRYFEPTRLTILGVSVPYAVVEVDSRGRYKVVYRIGTEYWGGRPAPPMSASLSASFMRAYPQGECHGHCYMSSSTITPGRLSAARLIGSASFDRDLPWAAAADRRQAQAIGKSSLGLSCTYN
jgi:hypothetical protein